MSNHPSDNTRERLLDHAERLFAVKGYDAVSIREITSEAESNLAAVNYHFGNKMGLYMEVFRERWVCRAQRIMESFAVRLAGNPRPTVEEVIEAMASSFLDGPLDDEEQRCHVMLMQRELAHPGEALKMVVDDVMRPYQQELSDLIRPHLSPGFNDEQLKLGLLGILGMTIYFMLSRPAVSMIINRDYDETFKTQLIGHITTFAVNGINTMKKEEAAP